ncbi:MAG: hypothetical protein K940chlam8_00052 [Chlamydiae bacterium]|nr:hypothetical protein [Chlamydiota bacterium]
MRRSILICEPNIAFSGQSKTWRFKYTTAHNLAKGAKLRFDLNSKGRSIDWEIPSSNLKNKHNVIYMILPNGKILEANMVQKKDSILELFEFVLPIEVKTTQMLIICIGLPPKSKKNPDEEGNLCQTLTQRRRPFYLHIDAKGKGKIQDPEIFSIDVKGAALHTIRAIIPSFVTRNKRFDVVVRFEDKFGNLTSNAKENTLIDLSYEHLRENLSWKLFVPETGYLAIPNLYFNEPGLYKLKLHNLENDAVFYSAPIYCFEDNPVQLFWGLFHGESEKFNSQESIESCIRHFRDEQALNFFFTSPFESSDETSIDTWKLVCQNVAQFNEDDRFVCGLGFQWQGENKEEGLRQMIYRKENKPLLRIKESKNNLLKKVYRQANPKEMLSIPEFTASPNTLFDFQNHQEEFEKVVEIYNAWGSSECSEKEGNPFPIKPDGKKGIKANEKGFIRNILNQNYRFGFTAGGLDDRGTFESFYDSDQKQYHPGLTAVLTEDFTKDALFDALTKRATFATTGERMIVYFELVNKRMGSILNTKDKPGLCVNRHLTGFAVGTKKLDKLEIIRNGKLFKTFDIKDSFFQFTFDDMEDLASICLPKGKGLYPFTYYYLRLFQENGHIAWSSPIWVDLIEGQNAFLNIKKSKKN